MNIRKIAYDTNGSGFGPNGHRVFNPYNGQAIEVDAQRAKELWGQYSSMPSKMTIDEYIFLNKMAEIGERKDDPEKAQEYMKFAQYILGQDAQHLQQTDQSNQGQQTGQDHHTSSTIKTATPQPQASKNDWYSKSGKKTDKWKEMMSKMWKDDSEMMKVHFINEASKMLSEGQKKNLVKSLADRHQIFRRSA